MPIPEGDHRIHILKTAFVIYYHEDVGKAKQFFLDFGMVVTEERSNGEIFFSGFGTEPFIYVLRQARGQSEFGGAAYEVESRRELERATEIAGASSLSALDAPGGGEIVTLTDPVGHRVHFVFGQTPKPAADPGLQNLTVNYEFEKPRKGRFQRFEPGPAPVHRWGHYGVTYPDGKYQEMYDWYTQNLALTASDIVYQDEKPITCFFHIDRGLEYTDHHAFFFKRAKPAQKPNVAHAAFEVHDFDIQQLGHQYLDSKGYELCWGVGRHVLGSQVFDYWFETSEFMVVSSYPPGKMEYLPLPSSPFVINEQHSAKRSEQPNLDPKEHYADGDLVNSETKVAHVPTGPQALSIWGPPVPGVF